MLLSEFDYEIDYIPGGVNSVPDAMSRIQTPGEDKTTLETEVPVFDVEPGTSSCKHAKILVTTLSRAQSANLDGAPSSSPQRSVVAPTAGTEGNPSSAPGLPPLEPEGNQLPSSREAHDSDGEGPDGWAQDDVDFDIFDFDIARTEGELPGPRDLPAAPSLGEILEEQRRDRFCQQVLASQPHKQRAFFEGPDELLRRRRPIHDELVQIVLPETLRPRVLQLCHYTIVAGHPGLNRMYYQIRNVYYWPQLAADMAATVRNFRSCARNRVKLRRHTNYLKLFTATKPFESVSIDILGLLPKSRRRKRFLLVTTDRFSKLTAVVPLRNVNAYSTAVAFCEAWLFKYGPPKTLLSDNGKQFASRFFLSLCQLLGVTNAFTSAYHPQASGQVERYNRAILSMLRCYVEEHQNDWDRYASALTYAYNNHVHRSTGITPFERILSRPPPPFSLHKAIRQRPVMDRRDRHEFLNQLG